MLESCSDISSTWAEALLHRLFEANLVIGHLILVITSLRGEMVPRPCWGRAFACLYTITKTQGCLC
ncbi:uncharacterized protein BDV17DRAFT_262447, partial [Aspergillus undulatus]|uniref:uncharacterized protein n=1 Tax=Aspergillus undulatus TaxID=1810928 RepID=UPI003CCE0813